MNFSKNKALLKQALNEGCTTVAQFAQFLKIHNQLTLQLA
jgi:hypothetical protein